MTNDPKTTSASYLLCGKKEGETKEAIRFAEAAPKKYLCWRPNSCHLPDFRLLLLDRRPGFDVQYRPRTGFL